MSDGDGDSVAVTGRGRAGAAARGPKLIFSPRGAANGPGPCPWVCLGWGQSAVWPLAACAPARRASPPKRGFAYASIFHFHGPAEDDALIPQPPSVLAERAAAAAARAAAFVAARDKQHAFDFID